jgi:multimeric flavodoxin WrbA
MKIVALTGGSKFGNTTKVVKYFSEKLSELTGCEIEYIYPADYKIEFCVGCHNCIFLGETKCPHHSQYAPIEKKLLEADGVILASPGYMFSVTGVLKNFLDHAAYNCHRPKYFGKKAYVLGNFTKWQEKSVFAPMETWLSGAGFEICGKTYVDMLPFPLKESELKKKRLKLDKAAVEFAKRLLSDKPRKLKFADIPIFHAFRTMSAIAPTILKADSRYFSDLDAYEKGKQWYIPLKVPFIYNLFGRYIGRMVGKQIGGMVDDERMKQADGRIYNEL